MSTTSLVLRGRAIVQITGLNAGSCRVDRSIRTLAIELTAHLNGCSWCADYGRDVALKQRVPSQKLDAIEAYATSPLFSPAERAALALAEAMTREVHVSDAVWDDAARYFGQRELVELVVAVGIQNFYTRVNVALGIESQGFCALPALARTGTPTTP